MSIFSVHSWVMRKLMSQQSSVCLFNTLLSDCYFMLNVICLTVSFFQSLTHFFAICWQSLVLQIVIKCQISVICSFSVYKSLIWTAVLITLSISSFSVSLCASIFIRFIPEPFDFTDYLLSSLCTAVSTDLTMYSI